MDAAGGRTWTIAIDATLLGFPPSLNARLHWAKRAKITSAWRTAIFAAIAEAGIPHLTRARVAVTLHTARGRAMDSDNIEGRCKVAYDSLTGVYVGPKGHRVKLPGILDDDDAVHMQRVPPTEVRDGTRQIVLVIEELVAPHLLVLHSL